MQVNNLFYCRQVGFRHKKSTQHQGVTYIAFFKHRYRSLLKNIASQPKRCSVNFTAIAFFKKIAIIYRVLDAKRLIY